MIIETTLIFIVSAGADLEFLNGGWLLANSFYCHFILAKKQQLGVNIIFRSSQSACIYFPCKLLLIFIYWRILGFWDFGVFGILLGG